MGFNFRIFFVFFLFVCKVNAQPVEVVKFHHVSDEIGFSIGKTLYLGDLIPENQFNTFGDNYCLFYKLHFGDKYNLRFNFEYNDISFVGTPSSNSSINGIKLIQNSNYYRNVTNEFNANFELNFLELKSYKKYTRFKPFIGLGIGILYFFNPHINIPNIYYIIPKETNVNRILLTFPISFGTKYLVSRRINIVALINYRLTNSQLDYLDLVNSPSNNAVFSGRIGVSFNLK